MKLKDKKIEILAVQSVINENGYAVETLEPICPPVWAYFRHLSGREYHAANAEHMHEEVLFTINWRSDITTAHVIRYMGVLWILQGWIHLRGIKGMFHCTVNDVDVVDFLRYQCLLFAPFCDRIKLVWYAH